MGSLIAMLVGKSLFGYVIGEKLARAIVIAGIALGVLGALWGAKCAYDSNLIRNYTNGQTAKTAKADRKADNHAAEQRRTDDTRSVDEAQQIKEAINEAGDNPADRRAAYYECVRKQQAARRERKPSPDC